MNSIEPVIIHDLKEMVDIVDEQDQLIGVRKLRTEVHRDGDWHREVHVWVYNRKGELLFQLRGPHQESFPNCWDVSVGGHVEAGSNYMESALKEMREELGIAAHAEELKKIIYRTKDVHDEHRGIWNRAFQTIFAYPYDGPLEALTLEKPAVAEVRFFTEDEMLKVPEQYGNGISLFPGEKEYFQKVFGKIHQLL